jgi:hypothetical protein
MPGEPRGVTRHIAPENAEMDTRGKCQPRALEGRAHETLAIVQSKPRAVRRGHTCTKKQRKKKRPRHHPEDGRLVKVAPKRKTPEVSCL